MGSCGSVASVAADIWKEYGEVAKSVGCYSASAASSGAIPYSACYTAASTYEATVKKMISFWNDMVDNSWLTIGPRDLEFNIKQTGTLVASGGRVFITTAPLDKDTVELKIKKTDGKAETSVTVCKYSEAGKATTLVDFTMADGKDNIGKEIVKKLSGVSNHVISIHLDSKSLTNTFSYSLYATKA